MNKEFKVEDISELIKDIHKNVVEHGWWDEDRSFGDVISLMHSELSEALEHYRNKDILEMHGIDYLLHYYDVDGENVSDVRTTTAQKPDGVLAELADVVIRIFGYVGRLDKAKEFTNVLLEKHEYNKTRPYKHGGKPM